MTFGFLGGELPEHIREALVQQIDRGQIASAASYHAMFTLFDEMKKEQMVTLGGIFHLLAQENGGLASYLEGITATYMRLKYDTCMGCGSSHTPNFEEAKDQENPPESVPTVRADLLTTDAEYQATLKKYNLEVVTDQSKILFRCCGCGQDYFSLEDRMLKKTDDCAGCHQKAKWG